MSTKTRIPLDEARVLADELVTRLSSACTRIEIAGSVRRGTATCGDIELVCQPQLTPTVDLFGDPVGQINELDEQTDFMRLTGVLFQRVSPGSGSTAWGERLKRATFRGFAVDLFSVLKPAQFGVICLIRTGPADFSHRLVTSVLQGGLMPVGMFCRDGALWRNGPIETPDEQDVFREMGLDYIAVEDRA